MIPLPQIREQLKIDDDQVSDALLQRWLGAAQRYVENRINRTLYPPGQALPADAPANALQLGDDIALAMLLLIGHWDSNRSDTTEVDIKSIPAGVTALIEPYRWFFE
ncbi:head-tail connector protein [Cupriavidus respiraculi]|uniref:Phage gp6-like head-tail connector protein n=1 Tax=Cupriavidus respiraculi TaxID=195930 RepID=A0ABM8XV46_9BURK|nr:head-tail connector protein [Cupriavidus respiraculi]CAG9184265.1 hypothetical protein LMG21510_05054 [Cupriavidus respiraculi]